MARKSREQSESVAEIGDLPAVVNPERRESCRLNLLLFLTTYFPNSTGLKPFSEDHARVIERIQRCILHGGRFVNAVYRGFAKTTISENSGLWAVLFGHRKFVPIFGSDQSAADGIIDSLKRELEGNDLLLEDFPEACYPIRCLEGKSQRQHSQTYNGELTHIRWTADKIVLPSIPDAASSGAIICANGLTGSRGLKHKRPDGVQQRPDFCIIDDPQTDESAASQLQVRKRLGIIRKAILKSAGHNKTVACVINATVIAQADLVDQLLDPQQNAAWQGERIKMVRRWADAHESLWLKQYAEIRREFDRDDPESQSAAHKAATDFYIANRQAMDRGCLVSWNHCFDEETEVSAIQHAYNALIDDGPEVFASECQNDPLPEVDEVQTLTASEISQKVNGYDRWQVPQDATRLTAFCDVQKDLLYWTVAAWTEGFTGYVVDYGTYPDQRKDYFALREARLTISDLHTGGFESALLAAMNAVAEDLCSREWIRDDSTRLKIERFLYDANWGESTDVVYQFARQCVHSSVIFPSHGIYVGAAQAPINDRKPKPGERRGPNWRIPPLSVGRPVRHVLFDSNFWKSFVHKRLATQIGDNGSLSLWRTPAAKHRMWAEHLTAEYRVQTQGLGRKVDEWKIRPSRPDNHYFDCIVGCAVGASIQGVRLAALQGHARPIAKKKRPKVSYL